MDLLILANEIAAHFAKNIWHQADVNQHRCMGFGAVMTSQVSTESTKMSFKQFIGQHYSFFSSHAEYFR